MVVSEAERGERAGGRRAVGSPPEDDWRAEILEGLRRPRKALPCKLLYDRRGSQLFEAITRLPEYYLTRTEVGLLAACAGDVADWAGAGCVLVEYGAGSSGKVDLLLERLDAPAGYVAVDVSSAALGAGLRALSRRYPALRLAGVCADYAGGFRLPLPVGGGRRLVLFLGSTVGNLEPDEVVAFLRRTAALLRPGDGLLVGADLQKDERVLRAAYDDPAGVTAAFNLNVLRHVNRRLGADFRLADFAHRAVYDRRLGRVEMHLVCRRDHVVTVGGEAVRFRAGDSIHTENSYKYTVEGFRSLARAAGLLPHRVWLDPAGWYSLHHLTVA